MCSARVKFPTSTQRRKRITAEIAAILRYEIRKLARLLQVAFFQRTGAYGLGDDRCR